ncbi:unnamed protein product [Trichobilharzia szidati]|nr:unnamed protein product [Trichobilharzia szidati]
MEDLRSRILDDYRANACDVIQFKLVDNKEAINSVQGFNPEFTHQIFGESEQIFGYRNLKIDIYYTPGFLSTYIDISYSSKVNPELSKGVMPDDIMHMLSSVYTYDVSKDLTDFTKKIDEESHFTPHGTHRHSYEIAKDKCPKKFSIFFIEHGMPGFEEFLEYHKRMESFILFFIDGASAIPTDDIQWCYYMIYENVDPKADGKSKYAFIGYMTIYKFYAYPRNLRPRVSQILILPPFRNSGHATQLLETFYRDFVPMWNVIDIAVEDPSPNFQSIRDFLDCKRCLETPEVIQTISHLNKIKNGQSNDEKSSAIRFRELARTKLKLNRYQSRRVYEILRLFLLPRSPECVKSFSDALTKRTAAHFQRVRPNAMRGSSPVPKPCGSNFNPVKKACEEIADKYFETQLQEEVATLLESYQETVHKLDQYNPSIRQES